MPSSRFVPGHAAPSPTPSPRARLFVLRGFDLLVDAQTGLPPPLERGAAVADGLHFLGTLDGEEAYAAHLQKGAEPPAGTKLVPARSLFGQVDEDVFGLVGRSVSVAEWDVMHRFCGRCGTPTAVAQGERSRKCPACEAAFYPRISPAVITLVERGEEVLLARATTFPRPWFSCLAGFVEAGESLEETVAREVREEVGVELADIRYFGSQSWPFGRSLMVGFVAQYAGGEVKVDGVEIAEARWFRADALPLVPPPLSIARKLIDDWVARRTGGR